MQCGYRWQHYPNILERITVTAGDPDNDAGLTYRWSQASPAAPVITFGTPAARRTTLTYPELTQVRSTQTFTLLITVTDSQGLETTATASVVVRDTSPPTAAVAAPDQTVGAGAEVSLDASGSLNAARTADGLTYAWTQVVSPDDATPVAGGVMLNSPNAAVSTFTAPMSIVGGADLHFRVVVTDEITLASAAATVTVRGPMVTVMADAARRTPEGAVVDGSLVAADIVVGGTIQPCITITVT